MMMSRIRTEQGMTLVELLIAMVVMSIGVVALVAGLGGGILAVERGSATTIAGTIADKQMEVYRQGTWASLTPGVQTPSTTTGSDGKTYWLQATVSWTCPVPPATSANTTTNATAPTCSGTATVRPVKLVSIDVRDTSSTGKLLFSESSTFDASTG